jgi:hypothetical protein
MAHLTDQYLDTFEVREYLFIRTKTLSRGVNCIAHGLHSSCAPPDDTVTRCLLHHSSCATSRREGEPERTPSNAPDERI